MFRRITVQPFMSHTMEICDPNLLFVAIKLFYAQKHSMTLLIKKLMDQLI